MLPVPNTTAELLRLIESAPANDLMEDEGLLTYVEMHLTQEQIDEVQQKLKSVLEYLQEIHDPETDEEKENLRKYRLTLAHYPLDRFDG